jgi:CDP-glucose 4,6-dehydratase
MMFQDAFRDSVVWVSGGTGFKGAWLTLWLLELGAKVCGLSLPPSTEPALYQQLGLEDFGAQTIGDIRDPQTVRASLLAAQPDYVMHCAALSLVQPSYLDPVETYTTSVMGTIHVLEALRNIHKPCAAVFITSDKCYENLEWIHAYREVDALGGYDPYSSSKAAAEIAIAAWRRSFFADSPVRIASGRAGNVIGGGDWAPYRIVPDCIRALTQGDVIQVRNPHATRPWQHVLEPLSGYLRLAAVLLRERVSGANASNVASAFNFGPGKEANRTVDELVEELLLHWPGEWCHAANTSAKHEATLLQLATEKAYALLGWSPVWNFCEAVEQTMRWYHEAHTHREKSNVRALTSRQIAEYCEGAREQRQAWAVSASP